VDGVGEFCARLLGLTESKYEMEYFEYQKLKEKVENWLLPSAINPLSSFHVSWLKITGSSDSARKGTVWHPRRIYRG